jgi:hypothetical protein
MLLISYGVEISHGSLSVCNVPSNVTLPNSNTAAMIDQIYWMLYFLNYKTLKECSKLLHIYFYAPKLWLLATIVDF